MSVISLKEWRKKQEIISGSTSQSNLSTTWEELGVTPTESKDLPFDENVEQMIAFWIVLDKAHREPFTVKSNFARQAAWHIGVCACKGLLSLEVAPDMFTNFWQITLEGLDFKENLDESITKLSKQQDNLAD